MIDIEKCKFTYYPDEVLTKRAEPVGEVNDNIHQLVEKMNSIMVEKQGLGLAAPQVGVSLRLFITPSTEVKGSVKVYINPIITPIGEVSYVSEGCLSVPGIFPKIQRYKMCKIIATNLDGNEFAEEVGGISAHVFQHEGDHIEGIIIIDHMNKFAKIALSKQLKKLVWSINSNE